jgi:DNA-binding CsgD family transcriptional regulator
MDFATGKEPPPAAHLRGRKAELDALRGQLDAVRAGRGGVMVITGVPGIGKTALLDAAERLAREREIEVFRASASVAVQVIPFGPLLEALMSAPGAPVDPVVLRDLSHCLDQRFWLLREVQESLERVALRGPALIVIDDMHWADAASLAALSRLPRQLATHRILWLFVFRSGELGPAAGEALARLEAADAVTLALSPLDQTAAAGVATDVLGGAPDDALLAVVAGVEGHPFLLTELLHGLRDERLVAVEDGTARLTGASMPLRFVDSVDRQLGRLSASARDTLHMAAVLGTRFSADELAALTGSPPATIVGALREALSAGLIVEDGDRLAFRHDLVREAVDRTQPQTVRQSLRRRAVDVMIRHGAPPSEMAELVMDVAQPGDTEAITVLRRAAAEAGLVCPTVASQLSRRALDLTATGDPGRGPLTAETLTYLMRAGRAADALRLMTTAARDLADPAAEAAARLSLAHLSMQYAPADLIEQCQRALVLPGVPAALRVQLLSILSVGQDMMGDVPAAEKSVSEAAEAVRASGDAANEVVTLIPQAVQALARGDWRESLDLARRAAARKNSAPGSTDRLFMPDSWQALICIAVARLDEAFALIDAGVQAAQRDGTSANLRVWSMLRCCALFSAGQLADARAEAEATIEMADEIGDGSYGYINHVALYILGRVALHTGDPAGLAQARRSAAGLARGQESPSGQRLGAWLTALMADGTVASALIAPAGLELLDPLATGPLSATSPLTYADSAALTRVLLNAGRRPDAESVVARLEDFAALHPDYPFLGCAALHARAILDQDPAAALAAVGLSSADPRPLVRASVLEDAGRLLPDARGSEGVSLLETALEAYAAAGAERDAARVRSLLRGRGVRPPAAGPRAARQWPELTESEFTVVSLVAEGATNRQVAERLYLSPYTVNSHLRHVFTKLGIRSRVELVRLAVEAGLYDGSPAAGTGARRR